MWQKVQDGTDVDAPPAWGRQGFEGSVRRPADASTAKTNQSSEQAF